MKTLLLLGVAGIVTAALVQPAAAQANVMMMEVTSGAAWSDVHGRLMPETQQAHVQFHFTVSIPQTLPGFTPVVCPFTQFFATFTIVAKPMYAYVTLIPSSTKFQLDSFHTQAEISTVLTVVTNRDAPAFEAGMYTVRAEAYGGQLTQGCTVQSGPQSSATSQYAILNDYSPAVVASTAPWQNHQPEPITIVNHGNGETRVVIAWELEDGTLSDSGRDVVVASAIDSLTYSTTVTFSQKDVPSHWSGRLFFAAASTAQAPDLAIQEFFLRP